MLQPRLAVLLVLSALLLAACGSGGGNDYSSGGKTRTPEAETSTPTSRIPAPFATEFSGPNEGGQAPIFWRTADNFASLTVDQPYKVLFRVDNGYAEPALSVTGVCSDCRDVTEPSTITLTGTKVTPVGEEAPGSFYPVNVLLPRTGHWELTVHAGADSVMIPVDVKVAP